MKNIVLIGTGTTAKTLFKFINDYKLYNITGFAVEPEYKKTETYCECPVFDLTRLGEIIDKKTDLIFLAMQWNWLNRDRKDLYLRLKSEGFSFANIIAPTVINHGKLYGENCWVSDQVIIEPNARIYENNFIKSKVWIGSNAIIHPHCFIGAGSMIGGGAEIGEQSFIGINATVFDQVKTGKKSIIGACTKVKRSLPDFSIVKIKPDSDIIIQSLENEIESKLLAAGNIR